MTLSDLHAQGWDVRRDEEGRVYARNHRGAGWLYVTPPNGPSGAPDASADFSRWMHPSWLSAAEFEAMPLAAESLWR